MGFRVANLESASQRARWCQINWILIISICALFMVIGASGQFLTKFSKSIPRMGRRSVDSRGPNEMNTAHRHSLIDLLTDEYGPDLLEKLEQLEQADAFDRGRRSEPSSDIDKFARVANEEAEYKRAHNGRYLTLDGHESNIVAAPAVQEEKQSTVAENGDDLSLSNRHLRYKLRDRPVEIDGATSLFMRV